jgi:hypothetical protein
MLSLICALWLGSAPTDLDVCLAAVRSHCLEVSCEAGIPLEQGKTACNPYVYDACIQKEEKTCRERFPG